VEFHPPVLVKEVIESFRPCAEGIVVDETVGTAGHSLALLRAYEGVRIVGIECDRTLAERARSRVRDSGFPEERFVLVEGSYAELPRILKRLDISQVDGSLFDLGACTLHFTGERGFSFRGGDQSLDMRFDPDGGGPMAADIVNEWSAERLERVLREGSDERWARRIARHIAERRRERPILTAGDLADAVKGAIPRGAWPPDTHPATRTFQALRVAANDEFARIVEGIPQAIAALRPGGRLAVISFHSGEDRLVKNILRDAAGGGPGDPVTGRRPKPRIRLLGRKPITAAPEEMERLPNARSAKLRVAEKLSE
jgi:16S rRNA (cytosine1402-N4)-methyltransferase